MQKTLKLLLIIFPILFFGCGYSVLNKGQNNNFNITEISMSGEKRINYNIRSKLLFFTSDNSKNVLSLKINTNKKKNIKDKNIKNEITKYQITITSKIYYQLLGSTEENNFTITETGDFKVSSNRLNTLVSEKKLIKRLTENIIKQITNNLNNI